jgi:hypothetical protein
MNSEKKALWVVFKMEKMPTKEEMRKRFENLYHIYQDHPAIESKVWLVNEEKNEWGALYVFRSEELLQQYLKSSLWTKEIPGRWGIQPSLVSVLDPGPILYKKTITEPHNSWLSE